MTSSFVFACLSVAAAAGVRGSGRRAPCRSCARPTTSARPSRAGSRTSTARPADRADHPDRRRALHLRAGRSRPRPRAHRARRAERRRVDRELDRRRRHRAAPSRRRHPPPRRSPSIARAIPPRRLAPQPTTVRRSRTAGETLDRAESSHWLTFAGGAGSSNSSARCAPSSRCCGAVRSPRSCTSCAASRRMTAPDPLGVTLLLRDVSTTR